MNRKIVLMTALFLIGQSWSTPSVSECKNISNPLVQKICKDAHDGVVKAQLDFAQLLISGQGVPIDPQQNHYWLMKSSPEVLALAQQGDAWAQYALSQIPIKISGLSALREHEFLEKSAGQHFLPAVQALLWRIDRAHRFSRAGIHFSYTREELQGMLAQITTDVKQRAEEGDYDAKTTQLELKFAEIKGALKELDQQIELLLNETDGHDLNLQILHGKINKARGITPPYQDASDRNIVEAMEFELDRFHRMASYYSLSDPDEAHDYWKEAHALAHKLDDMNGRDGALFLESAYHFGYGVAPNVSEQIRWMERYIRLDHAWVTIRNSSGFFSAMFLQDLVSYQKSGNQEADDALSRLKRDYPDLTIPEGPIGGAFTPEN